MTGKIKQGSSFAGVTEYAMDKKDAEILTSKDVRTTSAKLAASDFEQQRSLNRAVFKPVMHIALNFHKNDIDNLDNQKMIRIAEEVIDKMGYSNSQYLVVRHNDAGHPHMHLILNRVNDNGKTISDSYCKLRLNKIRKEIESKYPELTAADGKNLENINAKNLKGVDAVRFEIHNAINKEIYNSRSIDQLINNLDKTHGIKTELKYRRGSITHIDGIKFFKNNTWITGSKVDKSCSYLKLINRIEQNNQKQIPNKAISKNNNDGLVNTTAKVISKGIAAEETQCNLPNKKGNWTKDNSRGR